MAKEKKGEEVDTRGCEFEGLWAWRLYLFSSESRLMHGEGEEKEEADIGIAVALPLVAEWAIIKLKHRVNRRG